MAGATTSPVRAPGQTLGPAIVSALTLSLAATQITSHLNGAGLTPADHGTAEPVLSEGGPIPLHTAELGPLSTKIASITERALADGYNTGLLVTACACLVAAVISAKYIGLKPQTTRLPDTTGN
ncbi:hypothetical protein [Streptomyces sp. NPDC096132]|uniref:hypothetical protein n=1 Tax=Streptomyces sp. NPDC096132 TaxID=3366075 RepID=UPI00380BE295